MTDNLSSNISSRIGCHCWGTNPDSVHGLTAFAQVGCRWVRATRPMQMDVVSTGPRHYNFADNGERSIDRALELGMSIMGILDGRWGNETNYNALPYASPIWEHLDHWEDFVAATVAYYRDRVKFWEIINEPPFFWWYPTPEGVTMPEINPELHRAPIRAYVDLLLTSARTIRATDPTAKIVLGSGFIDGLFLSRVYELGGKDAFDIVSTHYLNCKHPRDFARGYQVLRGVMAANDDAGKELWDTENGPFGAVIGQAVQTPEEYEALYNIYRHCFAYEFGLDRYFWFNPVTSDAGVAHSSSIYTADGRFAPPYQAMQTLTAQVGNGTLLASRHFGDEVHAYVFDGTQGPVSILWATAPATVTLPQHFSATTHLGEALPLHGAIHLTGRPIFIAGDILQTLALSEVGKRETVVLPMKQPSEETPTCSCTRVTAPSGINDIVWENIPFVVTRETIPRVQQHDHFVKVMSSIPADLQIAYDDEAIYLRVQTYDKLFDPACPQGLVQFTLKDQNPDITEWVYFYNSYGLFNLYASPYGPMVLRFEHLDPIGYPAGSVATAELHVETHSTGLLYLARIPWREIGPCHPTQHTPFLMMFTFNRADGLLNVPEGDHAEEWSHNFNDNFIVKDPAVTCWVTFS